MNDLDFLMNEQKNPLSNLPPMQRFQIMSILGLMWTLIFCIGSGAWLWFGELAIAHTLAAAGFLVTGLTFHTANSQIKSYRDQPRKDGSARYDDVWGG